jgi:hypothetical protein
MPAKLSAPPTKSAEVRSLMASEVVKSAPDKDRLRFLGELLVSFEKVEAQGETAASKLLPTITAERDAALAKVAELQPLADRVLELETFKADVDSWKAEQVRALTEEANKKLWAAERARNEAQNISEDARAKFDKAGLQLLLDFVQKLIEQFSIPEPDPSTLPNGISSLILTCWGYTPTRATLMLAYARSFPEPNQAFRQTLLRHLKETLPMQSFAGAELPKPIENLADKISVLTEMAKRWNVWADDIQREFEAMQIERQAAYLRNHNAAMSAQEHDAAQRGEGRTPIGVAKPVSSVPLSEHGLNCSCKLCGGPPPASDWNGFIPADTSMLPTPETREDDER